jgi:phosphate transport system protein
VSHYEQRLSEDLSAIRDQVQSIGTAVREALTSAVKSLLEHDDELANRTILGDGAINRATRECDRMAHAFVVRHLPSARHLRFVSSVLRMNVALERVGDYARTVAREAAILSAPLPEEVASDAEALGRKAIHMLDQSVQAFIAADVELAREARRLSPDVKDIFTRVYDDLLQAAEHHERPTKDLFAYLSVVSSLERVSDQAKNVCEETVFTATGQTKDPKVYPILFVDRYGDVLAPVASAYARKAYPNSGRYDTGSWAPAEEIDGRVLAFLDRQGAPPPDRSPQLFDPTRELLSGFYVVVALEEGVRDRIPEIPYGTVFLQWDLDGDAVRSDDEEALVELYRAIAHEVAGLMEALRGADAD